MQYAIGSTPQFVLVQSADPVDLAARVNAAIAALADADFILNITLSGAGDGNQFVVLIEYGDAATVLEGRPLGANSGATQTTIVTCFAGADEQSLLASQTAALAAAPAPVSTVPYLLTDTQVAGSAKGSRFMGMNIYGIGSIPNGVVTPMALGVKTGSTALVAATPLIVTFTALTPVSTNFSLAAAGQAIRYANPQGRQFALHAIASISQTPAGPSAITLEIVQDPTGTPVVLGSMTGSVLTALSNENMSADGFGILQASSTVLRDIGLRITGAAAGFVTAASLFATPVPG